jgi:uncharacterized membrane protein YbhN (UPF0104 family)
MSLAASSVTAAFAGLPAVEAAVERLVPGWLVVAAGSRLLAYAGYTLAHHRVMNACESAEVDETAAVVAFGAGATSLKGGFAVDRRALRGAGASRRQASVHVLALALLEYVVLAPAAWISALVLLGSRGIQGAVTWPWAIGVPAGTMLAALLYRRLAGRLRPGVKRPPAIVTRTLEAARVLVRSARSPSRGLPAVAGMAVHWFAEIACLWASLRAFGLDPRVPVVILGYATGLVLTPRSLPLAGAGVIEVLLPLSLMWVGVGLASAIAAVLAAEMTRLAISLPLATAAHGRVRELLGSSP